MLEHIKQIKNRIDKLYSTYKNESLLRSNIAGQIVELRKYIAHVLNELSLKIEGRENTTENIYTIMKNCRVQDRYGNHINPFGLELKDFRPELFAESLSREMRFWNQTDLSVAEHCVNLSIALSKEYPERPELAKWAMIHEIYEAYTGDLATPFKRCLPEYKIEEDKALALYAKSLGLEEKMPYEVHLADKRMMITEALAYMPDNDFWNTQAAKLGEKEFGAPLMPYSLDVLRKEPLSPSEAREVFAKTWIELGLPTSSMLEEISSQYKNPARGISDILNDSARVDNYTLEDI